MGGDDRITVRIIMPVRGHRVGDVVELTRAELGLYTAFGWAVPHVEPDIERAVIVPLERRDDVGRRGPRRRRR